MRCRNERVDGEDRRDKKRITVMEREWEGRVRMERENGREGRVDKKGNG